jgi:hypothetical protein
MYKYFCSGEKCGFELWSHKVEVKLYCDCGYIVAHEDPNEIKKTVKKSRSRKSSTCDKSNRGSISQIITTVECTGEAHSEMDLFDYTIQEGTGEGT